MTGDWNIHFHGTANAYILLVDICWDFDISTKKQRALMQEIIDIFS